MNKIKNKYNRYRTLKRICYLLGFPLLLLLVYLGSTSFIYGDAFPDTKYYGLIAVLGLWLVVTILQAIFSMLCRSKNGRTMFGMIITLVVVIGGGIAFDYFGELKFTAIETANTDYNITMETYKYQINYFETLTSDKADLTDSYEEEVERFCRVYNIDVKSSCKSESCNADGSVPVYEKQDDVWYSPNGMYADGYIFSMNEAVDILITYNEVQAQYEALGKDADEELAAALVVAENSSEWESYKSSDEYKAAYGADGTVYKYMLNEERLDTIIGAIGANLSGIVSNPLVSSMVESYISVDEINAGLTLSDVIDMINGMGLFTDENGDAITIDSSYVLDLLADFSYYQSPTTKPLMEFIADDTLREYAYANYYAKVHGAIIGSVLVGDNIGAVNMTSTGYPSEYGFTLQELYQLRADNSYIPITYPLFAVRRYLYAMGGFMVLLIALYYHNSRKQDEMFNQLTNGGRR
jgi:hypothetical protein